MDEDLLKPSQVRKDRKPLPTYLPREVGGRFRVLSLLGSGACGDVVEAFDHQARGVVALKLLRAERVNENVVKRFFREATAMGRVKHPGVVRVIDSGKDATGIHYIAMELVRGGSLREVMRDRGGRLSAWEVARLAAEVCEVLQVAHSLGVIHRDLKPGNLIVPEGWESGEATVKVVDFGVAKIYDGPDGEPITNLTQTGESLGTPHYMAPEQISGRPLDGRADLYGLGCIMYHAVSGFRPIDGPNPFSVLMGHLERRPIALAQLVGVDYCPQYLSDFVDRMLEKDAEQRPVNAAAAEAEVRQFLDLLPRKAAPRVNPPPSAERLETFPAMGRAMNMGSSPDQAAREPLGPAALEPPVRAGSGQRPARDAEPAPVRGPVRAPGERAPGLTTPHDVMDERMPHVQSASLKYLGPVPTESAMVAAQDPDEEVGIGRGAKVAILLGALALLLGAIAAAGIVIVNKWPELIGLAPAETTDAGPPEVATKPQDPSEPKAGADAAPKGTDAAPTDVKAGEGDKKPVGKAGQRKAAAAGPNRAVELTSTPSGARVYRNTRALGTTPLTVQVDRSSPSPVVFMLVHPKSQTELVVIQPAELAAGDGPLQITRALDRLGGGMATVEIHSTPEGAQVKMGRRFIGIAPAVVEQPVRKQTVRLTVEGEGGVSRDILIGLRRDPQVVKVNLTTDADPVPTRIEK